MIDFDELKINDYILYTEPDCVWLGKVIDMYANNYDENIAKLQLIYSDTTKSIKDYPFYKDQCSDNNWSIPSDEQIKYYIKLMIFE